MDVARKQVEDGAMVVDLNVDDGMIDGKAAMARFLKIALTEPDVSKCPHKNVAHRHLVYK